MKYILNSAATHLLIYLILLGQPALVMSQAMTGSLSGTVTNTYGVQIPRARVMGQLRDGSTSTEPRVFETVTNEQGEFRLMKLPPGVYEVRVSFEGSQAQTERIITVPRGVDVKVTVEFGRGCDRLSEGSAVITDEDRAEAVRLTLAQALTSRLGLVTQEQREKGVVLLSTNVKSRWLKGVEGLTLMAKRQIQLKADREGDFLYISIQEIRVTGACISVTIANTWAVGKRSRRAYLSGGGYTFEYRREAGKWVGKFVSGWVS